MARGRPWLRPELVLCHGKTLFPAVAPHCRARRAAGAAGRGRWLLALSAMAVMWATFGSICSSAFIAVRSCTSGLVAEKAAPLLRVAKPSSKRGGWHMMSLGVPKVAYRIPGAQTAEWVDIYTRLYRERIIFLGKEIDDNLANQIIGVLLYLDSEDNKKPIYLYINSSGGSVIAGLAIYDTMQHIKSPVVTINVGLAASMASFLLASGEKGKRLALPHSRTMIHQAMGSAQGQAEDIRVEAQQILQIHENLVRMYAQMTGKPADVIREDLQRDNFMSAEEAKDYGLIDQVIELHEVASLTDREVQRGAPAPVTERSSFPETSVRARPTEDREEVETMAV